MPDVIINNEIFYNPVDIVLKKIGSRWKMPVLWRLRKKAYRYTELQKSILHISQKMLTITLKELEADGFIFKTVYAEIPPHTEYALTEKGKKAIEIIDILRNYGFQLISEAGVDYKKMILDEKIKSK